ncbi:hypothetical protein [Anthocerotibacter panamensis]|uniref:hypothetical protein n=1 Tax=Anthocerotibacter panamensis TaxID=2857077 RepID=UPI001C404430|nr:hypothetical protein [Anthocerotibacter panamensis]
MNSVSWGYILLCEEWSTQGGGTCRGILNPQVRVWKLGQVFPFHVVFFFGPGLEPGIYPLSIRIYNAQGEVFIRALPPWHCPNPYRHQTAVVEMNLHLSRANLGTWRFEGWLGAACVAATALEVHYLNLEATVSTCVDRPWCAYQGQTD